MSLGVHVSAVYLVDVCIVRLATLQRLLAVSFHLSRYMPQRLFFKHASSSLSVSFFRTPDLLLCVVSLQLVGVLVLSSVLPPRQSKASDSLGGYVLADREPPPGDPLLEAVYARHRVPLWRRRRR